MSVWWKVLEFLLRVGFGVSLVYLTLAGVAALLRMREVQAGLIVFGILVGLLWWLWSLVPEWIRKLVSQSLRRKDDTHER